MLNWIKEKVNPTYKPNEKEKLILDVIENLCNQNDTDIKMAPLSGRYYLVNKRKEYWINFRPFADERHWDNMGFEVLTSFPDVKLF